MPANVSEDYLISLAERTFLELWAIPNPYRSSGKEISDLIVAFGDDIVIFSDKAYSFDASDGIELAWSRWRRGAIDGSVKQLSGAFRRLSNPTTGVFLDGKAEDPLPYELPDPTVRRLHLVGIARPCLDPGVIPPGWAGLTYVDRSSQLPFQVEPLPIGQTFAHIFDGQSIDLLLEHLDTAPDFIAYLTARTEALRSGESYAFKEVDLLATAKLNWGRGGAAPIPPALHGVEAGLWDAYIGSDRAMRTKRQNKKSRTIDGLVEHFHKEYVENRFLNMPRPGFHSHERALRLLAGETRFARRVIATALYDLLEEDKQTCVWASTLPSPSAHSLRYVWLTYPAPPPSWSAEVFETFLDEHLAQHMLVACAAFSEPLIVGIALPNLVAGEDLRIIKVLDGSGWNSAERRQALALQQEGIFANLRPETHIHVP